MRAKTILDFQNDKNEGRKISMITAYDYSQAKIVNESNVDLILVGDSVAMVVHGYDSTVHATMEMMILHTQAVRRGAPHKFIVSDMPFMSFRDSKYEVLKCAGALIQAGANAVKIEGADGNIETIEYLVRSGIPVMGHLGLTPQSVNQLGGFKVQGRGEDATDMLDDAFSLEMAGCFSIVLECVPAMLAEKITRKIHIPIIGIGAGVNVDGQVLVFQDMLGMNQNFRPKFVRQYANAHQDFLTSINHYHQDVMKGDFPTLEESYQ